MDIDEKIELIQKAMIERGISVEHPNRVGWVDYIEPAVSRVFQKTLGYDNYARAWRTGVALWIYVPDDKDWNFKYFEDLTDEDLELFCKIHDIANLVPPEVYGKSRFKLNLTDEVEFMDI